MSNRPTRLTIIGVLSVIALGVTVAVLVNAWLTPARSASVPHWYRWHHPCTTSTGPGPCFWNADHRSDNRGTQYHLNAKELPFLPTKDTDGHDGCYIYVAAKSIIRCDDGYRTTN